jgi:O-acetyl-ADP-ribose deacetylase (regulator of RNase III)
MPAWRLTRTTLEIVEGDISQQDVDAIVNAANNELWMGAGVAGAIKRRGGPEIESEAMAQGPVVPGECVITGAGRLPARHVIHAAVMGQDLRTTPDLIERSTINALALAAARGLSSAALPAFGTGVGGFDVAECAQIMIAAIERHATGRNPVALVRLVLFGDVAYRAFAAAGVDALGPADR